MFSQTYYKVLKINALTQAKTIIAQHVRYMVWFEQNNNSARAPLTPRWYIFPASSTGLRCEILWLKIMEDVGTRRQTVTVGLWTCTWIKALPTIFFSFFGIQTIYNFQLFVGF